MKPHPSIRSLVCILAVVLIDVSAVLGAEVDPTTLFLTFQADPCTTMTVQWLERGGRQPAPVIELAPDNQPKAERRVEGVVLPFADSPWRVCRVHLTDLQPDTAYRFTVNNPKTPHRFRTAPARLDQELRFVSGGDCGSSLMNIRTNEQAAKTEPLFAVIGGDLAYADPGEDLKWVKYIEQWSRFMVGRKDRMIPMVPVIGNHETQDGATTREKAPYFFALFDVLYPERTYNVLDVGESMSLVLLDSDHIESSGGEQRPWLEKTLAERQHRPHVFAYYHVPAYPSLRKYEVGDRMRRKWSPLFEQFQIAAAFEHHDHIYKRTQRIRNERVDPTGIVYIGDGGWGRVRALQDNPWRWYLARREATAHFIQTTLVGDKRVHTAVSDKGKTIDSLETSRSEDLQLKEQAAMQLATVPVRAAAAAMVLAASVVNAATDPSGDCPQPALDIVRVEAKQAGRMLRIETEVKADSLFERALIFIDGDGDGKTGYAPPSAPTRGFDLLVQGSTLYRFDGADRAAWQWKPVTVIDQTLSGKVRGIDVDVDLLGDAKTVALSAWSMSEGWDTVLDTAPDQELISVALDHDAWPAEPAKDCEAAAFDLTEVKAEEKDGRLTITIASREPSPLDTTLILLDIDRNPATGYQSPARPAHGFELLVQGAAVFRHDSENRGDWAWKPAGEAVRKFEGGKVTVSLDAAALGSQHLRMAVMSMSADWQQIKDVAPDSGLYPIRLATKQRAAAPPAEFAAPRTNRDLPPRQRVAKAKSYYCYYGRNEAESLSHYDLVILESKSQKSRAGIDQLKALGVVVAAYITFGEDHDVRPGDGSGPGGSASWYFDRDKDNKPDRNIVWNSYYANAADPKWRADRIAEAHRLIDEEGYDGLFLDTLDTFSLYPDSFDGMAQLVLDLRREFPEAVIIMNQGLPLLPKVAQAADAVMLESFTLSYDFDQRQYFVRNPSSLDESLRRIRRELLPAVEKTGIRVLVLDYCRGGDAEAIQLGANRAATFGFLFAAAPIALDQVYDAKITGTPDAKWTQWQATPENMSHMIATETNGFPGGTKLLPSSCFEGYGVASLVDGVADRSTLHWTKAAWASAELDGEHWLEIRPGAPLTGGKLEITFAFDNGRWYPSHRFQLQARPGADLPWTILADVTGNTRPVVRCELPGEAVHALRIVQPAGGGNERRPNLLWLAQVAWKP